MTQRKIRADNSTLNEPKLIKLMVAIVDSLDMYHVNLNTKPISKDAKFKKLQAMFLGKKKAEEIESIDLQDYAKFVLRKREGGVRD